MLQTLHCLWVLGFKPPLGGDARKGSMGQKGLRYTKDSVKSRRKRERGRGK